MKAHRVTVLLSATILAIAWINNPKVVISDDGCTRWWTLIVSSTDRGSVSMPGERAFAYLAGESVPVEAVAEEGSRFTHWSGTAVDANAVLDPCAPHTSVMMGADYTLVAHFEPQAELWRTIYFNNFEGHISPEWSHDVVDVTPVGERRFLGPFGNDTVALTLANLPAHSRVRLSFDLFVIRSWDGNGEVLGRGPDRWTLAVDQEKLLNTTFSNHPYMIYCDLDNTGCDAAHWQTQAFPGNCPDQQHPPQTGAAETQSLGYMYPFPPHTDWTRPQDAVYHLISTCEHSRSSVAISFSASELQSLEDESWGLDNVKIDIVQDEGKAELSVSSTAGGKVVVPGEGVFTYDRGESVAVQAVAETGYQFAHWSGSAVEAGKVANPVSASTTVVADGNYTLVADFAVNLRTLTVSAGVGGSVTAPGQGSFQYPRGTWVPIQAVPKAHYYFTHWSGTAVDAGKVVNSRLPVTSLTLDADYMLMAHFEIEKYRLTVAAAQGGSIYVETRKGNGMAAWYDEPVPLLESWTQVTVVATPDAGWKFRTWEGTMGSTERLFTFELTEDVVLEALFVRK